MSSMGTFRTTILIESPMRRGEMTAVDNALVDTGSEYTWAPREVLDSLGIKPERTQYFIIADGRTLERPVGFAIVHAGGTNAPDLVVFAEPDDMVLLGARSLEGMNLRVDALRKQLVPAGPILAGFASPRRVSAPPPRSPDAALAAPAPSRTVAPARTLTAVPG